MKSRTRSSNVTPVHITGLHVGNSLVSVADYVYNCDPAVGELYIDSVAGTVTIPESIKDQGNVQLGYATYDPDALVAWARSELISSFAATRQRVLTSRVASMPVFSDILLADESDVMTDVVTPNFASIQKNGGVVFSPMTRDKVKFTSTYEIVSTLPALSPIVIVTSGSALNRVTSFRVQWEIPAFSTEVFGTTDSFYSYLDGLSALAPSANLQAAVNNSYNNATEGELQLLTALAESKQTVSHLASTGRRIASLYRSIKKGKFKELAPKTFRKWQREKASGKAKLSLDIISDAWLEARYAWRPLIIDIQQTIRYFNGDHNSRRKTYRGYDELLNSEQVIVNYSENGYSYEGTLSSISTSRARAGVLTELKPDSSGHVRDLGLLNPAGALWEAIPYSFVADWFLNISGVIASLNPSPAFSYLGSWVTDSREVTLSGSVKVTSPSGSIKYVNISHIREHKDRIIDTKVSLVTIDVNLDIYKIIDAAFLMKRWL